MQLRLVQLWVSSYRAFFGGILLHSMPFQHNNLTVKPVICQVLQEKKQTFRLQIVILILTEYIFGIGQTVIYGD